MLDEDLRIAGTGLHTAQHIEQEFILTAQFTVLLGVVQRGTRLLEYECPWRVVEGSLSGRRQVGILKALSNEAGTAVILTDAPEGGFDKLPAFRVRE